MSALAGAPVAARVGARRQVLAHGQMFEDAAALEDLEDALLDDAVRVGALDLLAVEDDLAVGDLAVLDVEEPRDRPSGWWSCRHRSIRGAAAILPSPTSSDSPRSTRITSS